MKKDIYLLLMVFNFFAGSFLCQAQNPVQLPLLSNWDDNTIPNNFYGAYSDCWGYVDQAGREYALLASTKGTYFFDVTDATNPALISFQKSKDTVTLAIHRDFKTYQHYAYGVCDEGDNALQIFDLQYLPDSVVKVYESNQFSKRCHNIFISDDKLFLAGNTVGSSLHAMDVLSLADPINPTFLSTLTAVNYVHDVNVKNDTAYCSAGGQGLHIFSYVNPQNPVLKGSLTQYPEQGYNHSSWLAPDGKTLVFADETHGSGLKVLNVSDFSAMNIYSIFRSNLLNISNPLSPDGSIPHNPFIRGNYVFISYYHDGVEVFDISNKSNPVKTAYYDTYPLNTNYAGYAGCWGVYPFLPSGHIIASDISNGLFMLDGSTILGVQQNAPPVQSTANIFYNGNTNNFEWSINSSIKQNISLEVFNVLGQLMFSSFYAVIPGLNAPSAINASAFAKGIYTIRLNGEKINYVKKICKPE